MNAEKLAAMLLLVAAPLRAADVVIARGQIVNGHDAPPAAFVSAQGLDKTYGSLPVANIKSRPVQETKLEVLNPVSNICEEHTNVWDYGDVATPVPCKVKHPFLDQDSAIGAVFSACDGYGDTERNPDCNEVSFWFPQLKAEGNNVIWNGQVVAHVKKGLLTSSLKLEKGFKLVPRVKETGYVYEQRKTVNTTTCPRYLNPTENNLCAVPEVPTSYVERTYTPITLVQMDLVADDAVLKGDGAAASK